MNTFPRLAVLLCFGAETALLGVGIPNAWIKPTSGYWEEQPSPWSLGVPPNQAHSVYITNAGWKAVAIGANTVQNFPDSMRIQDLQIASPTDSFNVFLMNFSGFQVPLQTTSLSVGSNSAVVVQSSSLDVLGNVGLNGNFYHGDFSQVNVQGQMDIRGANADGAYFMTNGTLTVSSSLGLGGFFTPGKFVQYGGTHTVGFLGVSVEGEYEIYGGQLTATNGILVGSGDFATSSAFSQNGGNVNGDMIVNGKYILHGGTRTGRFSAPASSQRVDASIFQSGGTNSAPSMELGNPNRFGGIVTYTLSNGVVRVDSSTQFRGGWFSQQNGQHTIVSNLVMQGASMPGLGTVYADYMLDGGTLSVGGLTAQAAHFDQDGGTNMIAGALVLGPIPPSETTWYALDGGNLTVKDISINAGTYFQHTGGNIIHSGLLTLSGGEWRAGAAAQSLGPLLLSAGTSNISTITFPGGASTLRLANSSEQPWNSSALLHINNWHGSTSGSGGTQLYFGSNASGLTPQQLGQIRFNISGRVFPARILASGEVVPVAPPLLQFTRNGGTLTLTWPAGWFLQSAPSVTGPYTDVPGTTSPYSVNMTKPQEFFRLRQ